MTIKFMIEEKLMPLKVTHSDYAPRMGEMVEFDGTVYSVLSIKGKYNDVLPVVIEVTIEEFYG